MFAVKHVVVFGEALFDVYASRVHAPEEVVIVPDRHGTGTNALVLAPPDCFEPSFGEGSFNRHLNHAKGAGLVHRAEGVPSLAHDVDTPEDLAALSDAVEGARTIAPRTRGALRQLERSGALVS